MSSYYPGSYDAVLLVSFGGPEKPDDVLPFLRNVTRGRDIPDERLTAVGEHYYAFGGRSPINDQCRALKAAVEQSLRSDPDLEHLPVYWGNRNWHPYLGDTMQEMKRAGVRRAICFLTSAYASYSSCRQYRENLADAREVVSVADGATIELTRLPHHFQRPGFVEPFVDSAVRALAELPAGSRMVFVTHSIPTAMNDASGPPELGGGRYVAEHRVAAEEIATRVGSRLRASGQEIDATGWDLVYCSRSGAPSQPWLEPDINDHLERIGAEGVPGVAVVPIGFVSDHMEVIYDLDTEARETADKLGMPMRRVATPGTDPRYVAMIRELVREQLNGTGTPDVVGSLPPVWSNCPVGCCANLRGDRPVAAELLV